MKRLIGILIGLATLTSVDAVLGRESAGGASGGRHASGGFAGAHAGKHGGRPGVHHGHRPGVHHGHHHHRPIVVVRPGWWWHHNRVVYGSTVVVAAPFFYPVYTPVPAPVYVEQSSDLRYYCPDYRDYYPNVATCPSQWMQVIPGAVGTTN
jgi:hypothetical protein